MFSLIWRFFPGPAWLRVIAMLAALGLLVYLLMTYAYPYVAQLLSEDTSTVG